MQDVSVLSLIENAWLKSIPVYRFEKARWNISPYSISPYGVLNLTMLNLTMQFPLGYILIIHRNAHIRWVSRLGRGLSVHP